MLKVKNTRVYGIMESLIAAGNPMMVGEVDEMFKVERYDLETELDSGVSEIPNLPYYYEAYTNSTWANGETWEKLKNRGIKLGNAHAGSGHDCFLKGIVVQADIVYPQYWSMQFQRYHFSDIISSQSKMHRLMKMDAASSVNKYVDERVIEVLEDNINLYNYLIGEKPEAFVERGEYASIEEVKEARYEHFMKLNSNVPMGLELSMRITTSYLQLKTMYEQRKHHKLKEDWGRFCAWCESLDYFVDFCLNGKRLYTDEVGNPLKEEYNWNI